MVRKLDITPDSITLGIEDGFVIKYDRSTIHIAGITTESGRQICSALGNRSLETGHSFDSLADAFEAIQRNRRTPCRVCFVAATLILNRKK